MESLIRLVFVFAFVAVDNIASTVLDQPVVRIRVKMLLIDNESELIEARQDLKNVQVLLRFLATFGKESL